MDGMDITTAATDTTEAMDITVETATTAGTDIAAVTTAETTVEMAVDMAADTAAHLPHVPLTVVVDTTVAT
jgi:hypothetical protein